MAVRSVDAICSLIILVIVSMAGPVVLICMWSSKVSISLMSSISRLYWRVAMLGLRVSRSFIILLYMRASLSRFRLFLKGGIWERITFLPVDSIARASSDVVE